MSEGAPENNNGGGEIEPVEPPEGQNPAELPKWARDALSKANKEAASYRKKAQEAEPILKKYKESEDAKKSETERLTATLTAAEERAKTAELKHLKLEIGLAKGLTAAQCKRLTGETQEELEADADDLIEAFGGSKSKDDKGKNLSGRPREKLRGGGDPEDEPEETDPRKLAAKIPRLY